MKFKNLILAGLALVSMAACSNEDDPQGTTSENVNAYMQLKLSLPAESFSRTEGQAVSDGATFENKLNNLQVVLVQKDAVVEAFPIAASQLQGKGPFLTDKIKLQRTGNFEVYVVANAPGLLSVGEHIDAANGEDPKMITSITEELMKSNYAKEKSSDDGNFIMFSECKGKNATKPNTISISEANTWDKPATCTPEEIHLERLAAKILASSTINSDDKIDAKCAIGETKISHSDLQLKGFKVVNAANKTYLQQKWAKEYVNGTNTLVTPATTNTTADFYNHLSQFRTLTHSISSTPTNIIYEVAKDTYDQIPYYIPSNGLAPVYCMENNPTFKSDLAVEASNGNTTGLIFLWQLTSVSGSDKLAGNNCFYSFDKKFYASLDALFAAYAEQFPEDGREDIKNELTTAYSQEAGDARETAISTFRGKYNIKVYTEGKMYYTYFIKDTNYLQDVIGSPSTGNTYSVMRNTIYNLNITKLLSLGTDIPGGWNPDLEEDQPVDSKNVYMEVKVSVNKWVNSNQDIELEGY